MNLLEGLAHQPLLHHPAPVQSLVHEVQDPRTDPANHIPDLQLEVVITQQLAHAREFQDPMEQELLASALYLNSHQNRGQELHFTGSNPPLASTVPPPTPQSSTAAVLPVVEGVLMSNANRDSIGESYNSDPLAPPGFPTPQYLDVNQNLLVGFVHLPSDMTDPVIMEKERLSSLNDMSHIALLGQEGAETWQKYFEPKADSKQVIQVPIEWVNFLSVALLSSNKFEWAKKIITSQVWNFIIQGSESKMFKPFFYTREMFNHIYSILLSSARYIY